MKPILLNNIFKDDKNFKEDYGYSNWFEFIDQTTQWINVGAPRDECFMAAPKFVPIEITDNSSFLGNLQTNEWPLKYSYRPGKFYESLKMSFAVENIMRYLNNVTNCEYDICFLNRYEDETKHLGWHADDSPEMDQSHPIASVSFGAEREIWIKEQDFKGAIPEENKYLLLDGSCFIMPPGFQQKYYHKIPKVGNKCDPRISLTFRKFNI